MRGCCHGPRAGSKGPRPWGRAVGPGANAGGPGNGSVERLHSRAMQKFVHRRVWAFDSEWVPDPLGGRLVHGLGDSVTNPEEVLGIMWGEGGATEEDPTPFLKMVLCRIVSIAAVERLETDSGVTVRLMSLPRDAGDAQQAAEAQVLGTFLDAIGQHRPQLVGFNSIASDFAIMMQRALVLGLHAPGICERPNKPWEGADYFARYSDWNLDIKDMIGTWGKGTPSLHELAVQSGIPGKMDVDGNDVARMWLDGKLADIVAYNEYDALTTYLVWLRLAHLGGHFRTDRYVAEQQLVREMVEHEIKANGRTHLERYLEEWDRLRAIVLRERGRG
jgi:predicted PolB exonuclease-like 3'-5' exonuclease